MQEKQSTKGYIDIYCSIQIVPYDSHGLDQLMITFEQSF